MNFQFSGVEQGIAASLAESLRGEFIQAGIDPSALRIRRINQSDMSVGDLLQLATSADFLVMAERGFTLASIAHCIIEFSRRHRVTISIDTDGHKIDVEPSKITSQELKTALDEAVRRHARSE